MNTELKKLATTVDERLNELGQARTTANQQLSFLRREIHQAAGQKHNWNDGSYSGTLNEALAVLKEKEQTNDYRATNILTKFHILKSSIDQIEIEREELGDLYYEFNWSRAFLVTNQGGHVHHTPNCSTCFPTTEFEWLTHYSSDPENEIVALAGETACTVCYPSAPAHVLNQPATIQSKNRSEREAAVSKAKAAKEARDAKRHASAPLASGEFLTIHSVYGDYPNVIKTERTAISEWNLAQDSIPHTTKHIYRENQSIIESALAGKHNVSVEAKREELLTKYGKRKR